MRTTTEAIKHYSIHYLEERFGMIEASLRMFPQDQLWVKPNPASNSMGNLVLHLCGNIRQYVISGLGGEADTRERDLEFTAKPDATLDAILGTLRETLDKSIEVIVRTEEHELLIMRTVQGYEMNGVGILTHVVEHLSYHTGQIAFYTKLRLNEDLGFYRDRNLNTKNT